MERRRTRTRAATEARHLLVGLEQDLVGCSYDGSVGPALAQQVSNALYATAVLDACAPYPKLHQRCRRLMHEKMLAEIGRGTGGLKAASDMIRRAIR